MVKPNPREMPLLQAHASNLRPAQPKIRVYKQINFIEAQSVGHHVLTRAT